MASSNVDYYSRQKELQDIMHEQEQKRQQLDQQLRTFCKKDDRLAKLRATKLQSYWKKVCDDQRRSQQRNQQILRQFEHIDSHLSTLTAKTERLRILKKQYEDYIERTYPEWKKQVLNYQAHRNGDTQQTQHQNYQSNPLHQQQSMGYQQQQYPTGEQQYSSGQQTQYTTGQQQQQQQDFYREKQTDYGLTNGHHGQDFNEEDQPTLPQRSYYMEDPTLTNGLGSGQHGQASRAVTSTPLRPKEDTSVRDKKMSSVYANVSEVTRDTDVTNFNNEIRQRTSSSPHPSRHVPDSPAASRITPDGETDFQTQVQQQQDVSVSEDVDDMISHPIQSITVKGITKQRTLQPRDVESPGLSQSQSSGGMEPDQEDDDEEEEESDFGDTDELPLSGHQAPTPGQEKQHELVAADTGSLQSSPDEEEEIVPQIKASVNIQSKSRDASSPELLTHGLIRLIRRVQEDFTHAASLDGYYRSHNPSETERFNIIQKANMGQNLSDFDAEVVSMVILSQMIFVVRKLKNGCLLPDSILAGDIASISQTQIRVMLMDDAKPLWDCLFDHSIALVKNKVMTSKEVAALFVPCMVSDHSHYQDKAFILLANLLPDQSDNKQDMEQITPREGLDSITRSSLGGVPPLKFGSLVERQYVSDDDTSLITQSVTSPKIPLNATEAYRSMLTGEKQQHPTMAINDDDEDTDNDDVEKQFASVVSPREHASTMPVIQSQYMDQVDGPMPQHEPLSDTSSAMSPASTQVCVPTAVQHESMKSQSQKADTKSNKELAAQQMRRPGIQFQSDLDTDTEIDILKQKQNSPNDDDFFDFYE